MSNEFCSFDKPVPAPYFRKSFELDFKPLDAELSICGLGFYRIYINGEEITKGALAPYISNPDDYCYYDTYQLADRLNLGTNVIGVMLGNGFYNNFGGAIWDFETAPWRGAPRLALDFTAADESRRISFQADSSFKSHPSPITFDDLRMGVYYDANLEIPGWNLPEYDDSEWTEALSAEAPRGEMKLCTAEPIAVLREVTPVSITKSGSGYLYDFGENNAGVCRLKIRAAKNQQISLTHGEELTNGALDMSSVGFWREGFEFYETYNQKDIYTAKGEGTEEFIPCFTYHGFRYVQVEGITEEQAGPELLTYLIMSSDLSETGGFHCSDETVNTLFEMAKRSDRSNFYYFPTDCPHREKNGWTGDASMSSDHMVLYYNVEKSWRVWLDNIRKAQSDKGSIPGIVPTGGWGSQWGNGPAWDSVLFNLPYQLYRNRGCIDVIRENMQAMIRYLTYVMTRRNPDGTISFGLGDWVPVGKPADQYDAPLALTDTIMVMDMARKAHEMLEAIDCPLQSRFAEDIYRDLYDTIRRTLIDFETMTAKGACQSSQALCLYYGVLKEEEKQAAFDRLLDFIHEKGDSFDCGFLGMHVLFHVLSEFGEDELAYEMITKKEYPSYGCLIERGETSLTECFMPEGTPCGSHNHHFLGDITRWFMNRLAGLNIIDENTVEIAPSFVSKLTSASAFYDLPRGRASVSWRREDNGILLDVTCAPGIRCRVVLPDGYEVKDGMIKKTA